MADLKVEDILARYRAEIYDRFATRGHIPSDPKTLSELNTLRALEASQSWRVKSQEDLARINGLIGNLIKVRDGFEKSSPTLSSEETDGRSAGTSSTTPDTKIGSNENSVDRLKTKDDSKNIAILQNLVPRLTEWPSNVSRYSGTGMSYGWDDHYIRSLVESFNKGARTQRGAHKLTTEELVQNDIIVTDGDAKYLNQKELSELTDEEKKYFKPIEAANYSEIPAKNKSATSTLYGKDSEVLIVVGAEKDSSQIGFEREAEKLKNSLEKNFGAKVKIIKEPSPEELAGALDDLGGPGHMRHSALYLIGHGGASRVIKPVDCIDKNLTLSKVYDGSFWIKSGDKEWSLTEKHLKSALMRVASRVSKIDLVVSACHSKVWTD